MWETILLLKGTSPLENVGRGTCGFLKEDEAKAEELKDSVSKVL